MVPSPPLVPGAKLPTSKTLSRLKMPFTRPPCCEHCKCFRLTITPLHLLQHTSMPQPVAPSLQDLSSSMLALLPPQLVLTSHRSRVTSSVLGCFRKGKMCYARGTWAGPAGLISSAGTTMAFCDPFCAAANMQWVRQLWVIESWQHCSLLCWGHHRWWKGWQKHP